jgi:hypothetical protein
MLQAERKLFPAALQLCDRALAGFNAVLAREPKHAEALRMRQQAEAVRQKLLPLVPKDGRHDGPRDAMALEPAAVERGAAVAQQVQLAQLTLQLGGRGRFQRRGHFLEQEVGELLTAPLERLADQRRGNRLA